VVEFGDGALSPAQVMSLADRMCYAAKDRGRDQVAIHHDHGQSGTAREPHRAAAVAEADLAAISR
jgi:hypothetical protein